MIKLREAAIPFATLICGHLGFGLFINPVRAIGLATILNIVAFAFMLTKKKGNFKEIAFIYPLCVVGIYTLGFLFGAPLLQYCASASLLTL
jgi:hypothetical protein